MKTTRPTLLTIFVAVLVAPWLVSVPDRRLWDTPAAAVVTMVLIFVGALGLLFLVDAIWRAR